jgi:aspartyl protease family protein
MARLVFSFAISALLLAGISTDLIRDLAPWALSSSETVAAPAGAPAAPAGGAVRRVTLQADRLGHFHTALRLEGTPVLFVVDTGASSIALTHEDAQKIGRLPRREAYSVPVQTANGVVRAARIEIAEVRLGDIIERNVPAMVLPQGALGQNLLGMSFLNRMTRVEMRDRRLVIED